MPKIMIAYATTEHQTERIALFIADELCALGFSAEPIDVAYLKPRIDPDEYDGFIVGASVHAGSHQRRIAEFVTCHRELLASRPSAFFSVSLSAASRDPAERESAVHVAEEFERKTDWHPDELASFAGALRYSEYNLIKRFMLKRIAKREGASTDTSHDHELTNWDEVRRFADSFAAQWSARIAEHTAPSAP